MAAPMRATVFRHSLLVLLCASAGVFSAACKKSETPAEQGAAPPPVASSRPGICNSGGGELKDPSIAVFFPRQAAGYCLDPNDDARAYGEGAAFSMDEICTQLFNGECEVYKSFGLTRVVTLRYVDGKGSPGSVNVNLSTFADAEGAFGFFSKRVIGEGDPIEVAPKPLTAGSLAGVGNGIAYLLSGKFVAELSYTNEAQTPDQLTQSSAEVLPPLTTEIASKLPGKDDVPLAVRALPREDLLPLGFGYYKSDALNVKGAGGAAIGYYKRGTQRYRVLSALRGDADAAKDSAKTLAKTPWFAALKDAPYGAFRLEFPLAEGPLRVEWAIAREGNRIWGVGDEELSLDPNLSDSELRARRLTFDEKLVLLKSIVDKAPR